MERSDQGVGGRLGAPEHPEVKDCRDLGRSVAHVVRAAVAGVDLAPSPLQFTIFLTPFPMKSNR